MNRDALARDLRHGLRHLRLRRGVSAAVVATLALGIGATTAVFTLIDGILLRPLPYPAAERLVRVLTVDTTGGTPLESQVSYLDLADYRREAAALEGLGVFLTVNNTLIGRDAAINVTSTYVSADTLPLLGAAPRLGRGFLREEDAPGGDVNKLLISHALWQAEFGGDLGVLGRAVRFRGDTFTVVGVMPPRFRFPATSDVWLPLEARYARERQSWLWERRSARFHPVLARLRPGVSPAQAQAELEAVAARLAERHPETNRNVGVRVVPWRELETRRLRPHLLALAAAALLVLLVGCVNVANLLLAQAVDRGREMAIRAALGSSLAALLRQLLVESLLVAAAGGLAGAAGAAIAVRGLLALIPVELPFWMTIGVDGRALAVSAGVALLSGVVCGLVPALSLSNRTLPALLREARAASAGPAARRVRDALVVAETAFALVLLVGAALMLESLRRLQAVDAGLRVDDLLVATVSKYLPGGTPDELAAAYEDPQRRLRERLAALPGVIAVASTSALPFHNQPERRLHYTIGVHGEGGDVFGRLPTLTALVSPGFFGALGIPLLEGRDFDARDGPTAPPAVIVNRHAAADLWPGRPAAGQELRVGAPVPQNPWRRVLGVAGDTKWQASERESGLEVYFPSAQMPTGEVHVLLRTVAETPSLAGDVRRIVREVDAEMAVVDVRPLRAIAAEALWPRRLWGALFAALAGLALVLAAVGVHGVLAYLVGRQRREIGVRMTLGASAGDVLAMVFRHGMGLVAAGIALGLLGVFGLRGAFAALLFGVDATDPRTLLGVSSLLALVAAVACGLPALRAARVDPLVALREE